MRTLRETVRDVMEGGPGSGRHKGESGKERFIRGTIAGEIKGLRQYRRMRGFGITGIISNKKLQAAVKRMKLAYHEPSIYRIAGNLRRQAQSTNWGRIKQGKKVHEGGPGSGRHSGGGTTTQDIAQLSLQRMNKKTGMIRIVTPEVVRLRHWRKKYVGADILSPD